MLQTLPFLAHLSRRLLKPWIGDRLQRRNRPSLGDVEGMADMQVLLQWLNEVIRFYERDTRRQHSLRHERWREPPMITTSRGGMLLRNFLSTWLLYIVHLVSDHAYPAMRQGNTYLAPTDEATPVV